MQTSYTKDNVPGFSGNICDACGVTVRAKRDKARHALGHLPEDTPEHVTLKKPFQCEWAGCLKRFSQRGTLEIHIAAKHTGEKKYICPTCDWAFADPSARHRHRRRQHGWQSPRARGPRQSAASTPYTRPTPVDFEPKMQFPAYTAPPVMFSLMPGYDSAGPAAAPDFFVDPQTPPLSSSVSSPGSSSPLPSPVDDTFHFNDALPPFPTVDLNQYATVVAQPMSQPFGMQVPQPWGYEVPSVTPTNFASYEEYPAIEQMLNQMWENDVKMLSNAYSQFM